MQNGGVILYKASSDEKLVICLTKLEGEPGQDLFDPCGDHGLPGSSIPQPPASAGERAINFAFANGGKEEGG